MISSPQIPSNRFGLTSSALLFLSSFLLFLIQPMVGRMILPWFGGTPAVWTTCMLFFQTMLLAGYAYAAILVKIKKTGVQAAVHLALLCVALFLMPITPNPAWKPIDGDHPAARILWMLLACVGWPYFLLAASSTLIQSWFAIVCPTRSAYRLYTLSNIGSLGALLIYPWLVEPIWSTGEQGRIWSALFASMPLGFAFLAMQLRRTPTENGAPAAVDAAAVDAVGSVGSVDSASDASAMRACEPSVWDRVAWFLLPALASTMLLGVTNYLCQDVAVIPFLWIAPLSVYLLSLILCFERDAWYRPRWFSLASMLAIGILFAMSAIETIQRYNGNRVALSTQIDIRIVIVAYLAMFFLVCMVCHGETVRRRPALHRLSEFYLSVAGGGALGAFIVAILCPLLFSTYFEFNLGLVVCLLVASGVWMRSRGGRRSALFQRRVKLFALGLAIPLSVLGVYPWWVADTSESLPQVRNFYGTLTVRELSADEPEHHGLALFHGSTMHGFQLLAPDHHRMPTAYFTRDSGIGMAIAAMQKRGAIKVGVVGLGIGTLAAYGRSDDTFRFYEINPLVVQIAHKPFTFLQGSAARIEIVEGDARLALEREAAQEFDLLILDAFSSDAVPVHLLTEEAVELYLRHLQPHGLIAFQVTNRNLDLVSVVARHAEKRSFASALIRQEQAIYSEKTPSAWFLMSPHEEILNEPSILAAQEPVAIHPAVTLWTDNHHNLFRILRASRPGSP